MTYEYICTACGHQWEAEQPISADPLKKCPECKRRSAKRQVSGGLGFILKGSGWYADGYGLGTKKEGGGDVADTSPSAEAKPSQPDADTKQPPSKSDAKPKGDDSKNRLSNANKKKIQKLGESGIVTGKFGERKEFCICNRGDRG